MSFHPVPTTPWPSKQFRPQCLCFPHGLEMDRCVLLRMALPCLGVFRSANGERLERLHLKWPIVFAATRNIFFVNSHFGINHKVCSNPSNCHSAQYRNAQMRTLFALPFQSMQSTSSLECHSWVSLLTLTVESVSQKNIHSWNFGHVFLCHGQQNLLKQEVNRPRIARERHGMKMMNMFLYLCVEGTDAWHGFPVAVWKSHGPSFRSTCGLPARHTQTHQHIKTKIPCSMKPSDGSKRCRTTHFGCWSVSFWFFVFVSWLPLGRFRSSSVNLYGDDSAVLAWKWSLFSLRFHLSALQSLVKLACRMNQGLCRATWLARAGDATGEHSREPSSSWSVLISGPGQNLFCRISTVVPSCLHIDTNASLDAVAICCCYILLLSLFQRPQPPRKVRCEGAHSSCSIDGLWAAQCWGCWGSRIQDASSADANKATDPWRSSNRYSIYISMQAHTVETSWNRETFHVCLSIFVA
jgi:hypothetical protein